MATHREGMVRESIAELEILEQRVYAEADIRLLRMLKHVHSDPTINTLQLAESLQVSGSTVRRMWRAYRRNGIAALLARAGDNAPPERVSITHAELIRFCGYFTKPMKVEAFASHLSVAVAKLFRDIDHVSINVNTKCDLLTPESYHPDIASMNHAGANTTSAITDFSTETGDVIERLLIEYGRRGFPLDKYLQPHSIVLRLVPDAYLGTIILWRKRRRSNIGISASTIELALTLRPLFEHLFVFAILGEHHHRPALRESSEQFRDAVKRFGLTRAEERTAPPLLEGRSTAEIARMLTKSVNTIRSHRRSIYRKAGVSSLGELFALVFEQERRKPSRFNSS